MMSATRTWGSGAILISFVALAILRFDLVIDTRHYPAKVVAVQSLPQMGIHSRAVLVKLGEGQRVLWTHDRYIETQVGAKVCVTERRYLLRRFVRYALQLSAYCPGLKMVRRSGDSRPAMSPGD